MSIVNIYEFIIIVVSGCCCFGIDFYDVKGVWDLNFYVWIVLVK